MRRYILSATAALLCAGALTIVHASDSSAQLQPQTRPPSAPPSESSATAPRAGATALVGCLYRERDVPGRSPNIAEKAGVREDYILADAAPTGSPSDPDQPGHPGQIRGLATGRMYKVEKIADDRLQKLVGKRVEVVGRIDAEPRNGQAEVKLPEFEANSIREVAGSCEASSAVPPAVTPKTPDR